jgi:ribosomal protein L37AE/L43A
MTDRICPKCTSAIVLRVVDKDQRQTGWHCATCGLEWIEKTRRVVIASDHALPSVDPIRGGRVE